MLKIASVVGALLLCVSIGTFCLVRHSTPHTAVSSDGTTSSPGVEGRKWLEEHGYLEPGTQPPPHARRRS
jgi:hypothetical protein